MIDRHGNRVFVGWPDFQILWLEAALELDKCEHTEAFQQIADMTGRTLCSVREKAYDLRRQHRIELERLHSRSVMVPARGQPCPQRVTLAALAPSEINTSAAMAAKRVGARA